jgi:hypothetical protein
VTVEDPAKAILEVIVGGVGPDQASDCAAR